MLEIIPAVLPKNYEELKNKVSLVRNIVPIVQIDICDGVFVNNITWPFIGSGNEETFLENSFDEHFRNILNEQEGLPFWEDIDFELDLMVSNVVENFDIYMKLGPRRIVFHLESAGDLQEFKDFLEGLDSYVRDVVELGIAVNTTTPIEQVFPLVNSVDFIQVMGIKEVGLQGQDFDPTCIQHIKKLKEKFSDLIISVDGAVSFETAPKIVDAGATRLVIGSAIFNTDDIIDTIERFRGL